MTLSQLVRFAALRLVNALRDAERERAALRPRPSVLEAPAEEEPERLSWWQRDQILGYDTSRGLTAEQWLDRNRGAIGPGGEMRHVAGGTSS